MTTEIHLRPPAIAGRTATISWSVTPATELYHATEFSLRFPDSVDLSGVPDALWWRVALLCLHSQWPLLRPCRVVLPFRLDPGEREFWLRMCDAEVATLEGWAGGGDFARRIDIVESGSPLESPDPVAPSTLAAACFSGGRDSITQAALLSELGFTPLLVTTHSPREGSFELETPRHKQVMADIQARRGFELIEVGATLRGSWELGFTAERYPARDHRDRGSVPVLRGGPGRGVRPRCELDLPRVRGGGPGELWFGGQIVQFRHFTCSAATQRSLSALFARFGISYGGLTYPLRQFQVQRLLGERYPDLRDLQDSCFSMALDEAACSRCAECRNKRST